MTTTMTTTTRTRIDRSRSFHAPCPRDGSIPAAAIVPQRARAPPPSHVTFLQLYNNVARRGGVPPSQANRETKEVEVSLVASVRQVRRPTGGGTHGTRPLFTAASRARESKEGSCTRQRARNEKRAKPLLSFSLSLCLRVLRDSTRDASIARTIRAIRRMRDKMRGSAARMNNKRGHRGNALRETRLPRAMAV